MGFILFFPGPSFFCFSKRTPKDCGHPTSQVVKKAFSANAPTFGVAFPLERGRATPHPQKIGRLTRGPWIPFFP